jgi:hypothetical protein
VSCETSRRSRSDSASVPGAGSSNSRVELVEKRADGAHVGIGGTTHDGTARVPVTALATRSYSRNGCTRATKPARAGGPRRRTPPTCGMCSTSQRVASLRTKVGVRTASRRRPVWRNPPFISVTSESSMSGPIALRIETRLRWDSDQTTCDAESVHALDGVGHADLFAPMTVGRVADLAPHHSSRGT